MADISLRDRNGNKVNYPGVERIQLNTVDGQTAEYVDAETIPEVVENMPIALDFSNGNQDIVAPDGTVVKSATIAKPTNLVPQFIAEGVDIAGIIGTMASGGGGKIKVATGTISQTTAYGTVKHSLGVVPDILFVYIDGEATNGTTQAFIGFSRALKTAFPALPATNFGIYRVTGSTGKGVVYANTVTCIDETNTIGLLQGATAEQFTFGVSNNFKFGTTATKYWIAIGGLT